MRGTAYDPALFANLCDDHLKKPANENLRQSPLFYRWAISSWPSASWVQLRLAIVPLWSEAQQIGKGSGPHDGVKGFGIPAKVPVPVTGPVGIRSRPAHADLGAGSTTKVKSPRVSMLRAGCSSSLLPSSLVVLRLPVHFIPVFLVGALKDRGLG